MTGMNRDQVVQLQPTRPRGQTLKAKIMGKDEIENETFKITTTAVAYM